jgi:hypothetical protein
MPTKKRKHKEMELHRIFGDKRSSYSDRFNQISSLDAGINHLITMADSNGNVVLNPGVGTGGNRKRKDDREDEAKRLKAKYREIWGVRGKAKNIALDEGLHISTIQKYFKDFK